MIYDELCKKLNKQTVSTYRIFGSVRSSILEMQMSVESLSTSFDLNLSVLAKLIRSFLGLTQDTLRSFREGFKKEKVGNFP